MRGADSAKVAEEESIGPEGKASGDLVFISQYFMPEEIDAAIFSQQPGEISPVIGSLLRISYHLNHREGWNDIMGRS